MVATYHQGAGGRRQQEDRICFNVIVNRYGCPILTLELLQLGVSLPEKFALQPEKPILPATLTPEQPPHGALKLETTFSVRYLDPVDSSFLLRFRCGDIFLCMLLRLLLACHLHLSFIARLDSIRKDMLTDRAN